MGVEDVVEVGLFKIFFLVCRTHGVPTVKLLLLVLGKGVAGYAGNFCKVDEVELLLAIVGGFPKKVECVLQHRQLVETVVQIVDDNLPEPV